MAFTIKSLPQLRAGRNRLFLCRHGETEDNARKLLQGGGSNPSLNEKGKDQATQLARCLREFRLDFVASSTLARAIETADAVAAAQPAGGSAHRQNLAELVEMHYGSLEGRPMSECKDELRALSSDWTAGNTHVPVADGESPETLLERGQAALRRLLRSDSDGHQIACVAHSNLNKAILASATGKGLGALFTIPQDNACINVLDYVLQDESFEVLAVNISPVTGITHL
jgi:broad specificity phosphatase PhoE